MNNDQENKNTVSEISQTPLLKPIKLGPFELLNRFVMAALTRCRADPETCVPNEMHVQYYSERAENTGFILTECSGISKQANTFLCKKILHT